MSHRSRIVVFAALLTVIAASLVGVASTNRKHTAGASTVNWLGNLPVRVVPNSIPHGSTCAASLPDVTAALQAWITSLPNYTVARLGANQCYHVEYTLLIGAKTAFVFDGNGSTLAAYTDGCDGTRVGTNRFINCRYPSPVDANGRTQSDWPQRRSHLHLLGNQRVIVTHVHIEGGKQSYGYNADYAFQHGLEIEGKNDGTVIDNVTLDHIWGDYVNFMPHSTVVAGVKTTTYPQNVTVQNSHFGLQKEYMGTGRQGINIGAGANLYIRNNVIQYSSRSAIDIEPTSDSLLLKQIYIEHNTFGPHANNLFANHYYGDANPVIDGIYFRYNILRGTPLAFDSVVPNMSSINANDSRTFRRHNYQIVGNRSDTGSASGDCPGPNFALRFWGIDGLVLQDNDQGVAPSRCIALIDAAKVRNSRLISNRALNSTRMATRYYQSAQYCEKSNLVANPLRPDTSGLAPTCS